MSSRQSILFLCTGNSCRSQMAEGWTRAIHAERYDVSSAGLEAHGLNPQAVQVMAEAGVDITGQTSDRIEDLDRSSFDVVVTVCGHADEHCPTLPIECRKMHVPFDDPPALAHDATSEEEAVIHYRRVRDEIRSFAERLPELLAN